MKIDHERLMHRAATLVGGYAGMYTVMVRLNLGSSQTVCWLDMLKALLGRSAAEFMLRLAGVLIYGGSVFAAAYLTKRKHDTRLMSAVINLAGFLVLGFMPADINHCIALYPTFIMMSFMWVVFGSMGGYASAPIFSTNNYRQTIGSVAEYLADGDRAHLDKAKYFAGTLLVFHIGAAAAYLPCTLLSEKAAFFGIVPTVMLLGAIYAPKLAAALHIKIPMTAKS